MISAVQRHISQTTTGPDVHPMLSLPPPHLQIPPIPPIINTNPIKSGAVFERRGSFTPHQDTDNSVGKIQMYQSMVKVTMVLFLMSMEPESPEGYVSYSSLFLPWLPIYLHNYIRLFPLRHGYIILE